MGFLQRPICLSSPANEAYEDPVALLLFFQTFMPQLYLELRHKPPKIFIFPTALIFLNWWQTFMPQVTSNQCR